MSLDVVDDGGVMLFWTPDAPGDERRYREVLRTELGGRLLVALKRTAAGRWSVEKAASWASDDVRSEVVRVLAAANLPVE